MDKLGAPSFATTFWWGSSDFRRGEQKAFVYFILGGGAGAVFMGFIRVLCGGFSYMVMSLFWAG